jgi:hypothetical protein
MELDPERTLAARIYYGWPIIVALLLTTTGIYGTSDAFGVFYDSFADEFGVPRSVAAGVFGAKLWPSSSVSGRSSASAVSHSPRGLQISPPRGPVLRSFARRSRRRRCSGW